MIRYPLVSTCEAGTLRHASAGDLSACEGLAPEAASLPVDGSTQIVCKGPAWMTKRPELGSTGEPGVVVTVVDEVDEDEADDVDEVAVEGVPGEVVVLRAGPPG